jgi:phospholipid:diacylglycerol acyltransferase
MPLNSRRKKKAKASTTLDSYKATGEVTESKKKKTKATGKQRSDSDADGQDATYDISEVQSSIGENVDLIKDSLKEISEVSQRKSHKGKKKYSESRKIVFLLGTAIGVLLAVYFGSRQTVENFDMDFVNFDNFINFDNFHEYFDDWKVNLPAGVQTMIREYQQNNGGPDFTESFAVGKALRSGYNISSKYPVIMIPGVISTGIESWGLEGTPDCPSQPHFRKRLWGSMYMIRTMVLDKACWLKHVMLDTETGLDPPGIKLRSAQGFEAADFFMAGYWIWGKILENLAAIGYEPNKMVTAAYDWRLSYLDLERRDSYFSKLQQQIELEHNASGEKTVLVCHSMGSQIAYYFMKWVEAPGFGNGGSDWVNKHIYAFVDISGSMLGAPKAVPALLSGEMKDTVQLNALAVYGLEKFFSRRERLDMLRSFGGVASMLPKGGDFIWGNSTSALDDSVTQLNSSETHGKFIKFQETVGKHSENNLTMGESIDFIFDNSPDWFGRRSKEHYSYGIAQSAKELKQNNKDFSKWVNPLEAPLPNAPDLKIFCFYGVGNPTERSYVYQEEKDKGFSTLNVTIKQPSDKQKTVLFTDGDGTIPLLTHSMCHKWKEQSAFNPGNAKVKVVELKHDPDRFDIRGGAKTAEHVDVLGSAQLNDLVLKVASGRDDLIEENIITDLSKWVKSLDFGF